MNLDTQTDQNRIHHTAIVAQGAKLADDVTVGPYTVIGPDVTIGPGTTVGAHCVIEGITRIGAGNRIFQFASIGAPPQDLKYAGEPTSLEMGDSNVVREFVTIHRGTEGGGGVTRIGDHCLFMAYTHVAHDCIVGDRVVMANGATLGGHVEVGDHVVMGGLSAVHQFCKIGTYAFLGGMSGVSKDVPPYTKFWGPRGKVYGINKVGLRRAGFSREALNGISDAFRMVFQRDGSMAEALDAVEKELGDIPEVGCFIDFIRRSKRGIPSLGDRLEDI